MSQDIYLTGITTTGTPHIGNYVGAIRPGIAASKDPKINNYYFLADLHSLAKTEDPGKMHQSTLEIAAAWLALGLDTDNAMFYRQSDIPEISQLTWILTGMTVLARLGCAVVNALLLRKWDTRSATPTVASAAIRRSCGTKSRAFTTAHPSLARTATRPVTKDENENI